MECIIGLLLPALLLVILAFVVQYVATRRALKELQARMDRLETTVAELVVLPMQKPVRVAPATANAESATPANAKKTAAASPTAVVLGTAVGAATTPPVAAPTAPEPARAATAALAQPPPMKPPTQETPRPVELAPPPPLPPKAPWYTSIPLFDWFARANLMVQIGLVVLFIGVAFLLKFAVDQGWISIELRHIGVAVGALALGGIGWWLRKRRRVYGLALQGGALAILYLTTYSAFRLYELIPASAAFAIFVGLGVVGCGLALLGDAAILAFLSTAGAFAAPLLTAGGAGSYWILFGYYALLNLGVLAIALFKSWHGLNLVSFVFTFGVGLSYTFNNFGPADYWGMQGFVLLFFALYLVITVLVALRSAQRGPASVSVVLAFGVPTATLVWQGMITDHLPHGLGYSALAGAAIYLAVTGFLFLRPAAALATLREVFLFLGLFLATIAVPSFYDPRITAAIWTVSGGAWVWFGEWRRARWMPLWGAFVQLTAGLVFSIWMVTGHWSGSFDGDPIYAGPLFLSPFYVSCALLGLAAIVAAYALYWPRWQPAPTARWARLRPLLSVILLAWGFAWWFGGGIVQVMAGASEPYVIAGIVTYLALSCGAADWIAAWLRWPALRAPVYLLLPALFVLALLQPVAIAHPLEGGAWYAWPLALLIWYGTLWRMDRAGAEEEPALTTFAHAGTFWLVAYLAVMAAHSFAWHWTASTTLAAAAALFVFALLVAGVNLAPRLPQPVGNHAEAYRFWGAAPVAAAALVYLVYAATVVAGDAPPLPYLPLLNPMDLASAAVLAATLFWLVRTRPLLPADWEAGFWALRWVWGAVLLYVLSTALARAVHQLTGVRFTFDALYASELLQALLSILWGAFALLLMLIARLRRSRSLWVAGALVLALTVLKLFLVDLANVGTVARIASFIGVGLLIIVIAFFAPVPPKQREEDAH